MNKKIPVCIILLAALTSCTEPIKTIPQNSFSDLIASSETTQVTESSPAVTTTVKAPENAILEYRDFLDVYDKITVDEFVYKTNVNLLNGNDVVDTSKTGKSDIEVQYSYMGNVYEQKISYIVNDNVPPLLLSSGDGSAIEVGTSFDLNDHVGFCDNYDRKPLLTYEGSVDTGTVGSYPITATVTDSSGNETNWDLTIYVKDQITAPEDNEEQLSFESFVSRYGGAGKQLGIDVSRWQGDIDFQAVKNAGCEFVIIRIGSYFDEYTLDSCYAANIAAANKAGLNVGVYIYTTANTEQKVKENVKWIIEQLGDVKLNLPVVFDWECFYEFQKYNMNIHDLNELFNIFAVETKKYGYDAMLYSSKNYLNDFWYEQTEYPVWLAHYTDETNYTGKYDMWQVSSHGSIPGIEGNVDLNILYTDLQ